jgi:hypothetical protein
MVTLLPPLQQLPRLRRNSDPHRGAPNKKDEGSLAFLVLEYCSRNKSLRFKESPRFGQGRAIREVPLSAVLTLAGLKIKLPLDD